MCVYVRFDKRAFVVFPLKMRRTIGAECVCVCAMIESQLNSTFLLTAYREQLIAVRYRYMLFACIVCCFVPQFFAVTRPFSDIRNFQSNLTHLWPAKKLIGYSCLSNIAWHVHCVYLCASMIQ